MIPSLKELAIKTLLDHKFSGLTILKKQSDDYTKIECCQCKKRLYKTSFTKGELKKIYRTPTGVVKKDILCRACKTGSDSVKLCQFEFHRVHRVHHVYQLDAYHPLKHIFGNLFYTFPRLMELAIEIIRRNIYLGTIRNKKEWLWKVENDPVKNYTGMNIYESPMLIFHGRGTGMSCSTRDILWDIECYSRNNMAYPVTNKGRSAIDIASRYIRQYSYNIFLSDFDGDDIWIENRLGQYRLREQIQKSIIRREQKKIRKQKKMQYKHQKRKWNQMNKIMKTKKFQGR